MNMFVSCGPGFGIREVFCGACPPHHYSPDGSVDCFRCSKGFHQPVAGSAKCVKCPSFFVPGCNMVGELRHFYNNYNIGTSNYTILGLGIIFAVSYYFDCTVGLNKGDLTILPNTANYNLLIVLK